MTYTHNEQEESEYMQPFTIEFTIDDEEIILEIVKVLSYNY